jgi:DUF3102 family protein
MSARACEFCGTTGARGLKVGRAALLVLPSVLPASGEGEGNVSERRDGRRTARDAMRAGGAREVDASSVSTLAAEVRAEHEACERDAQSAVAHAIRAGELLTEAKARCEHGGWLTWLGHNVRFGQQTANAYMRIFANYGTSRDLPSSVNAALKQLAVPKQFCPGCGRQKHPDRFTGDRCNTCIKEMSVEKPVSTETVISTYDIDSRKRQLADKAAEGFWNLVGFRSSVSDRPLHELVHLERVLAVSSDEEIADAIERLEKGIAETKALVRELRRHREGRGS